MQTQILKKMQPDISVIIPVYKSEDYIRRCVESLFNQTLKEGIEFIFIDDCSPDRSIAIVEETLEQYPERKHQVKIVRHIKNGGSARARNTGMENASGRYIIGCDSDDWVESHMYEELLKAAKNEDADIVFCNYIEEYRFFNREVMPPIGFATQFKYNVVAGFIHNGLWNKLIKRSLFTENNIRHIEGLNFWEDVLVLCRVVDVSKKVSHVHLPLYHYSLLNPGSYVNNWTSKNIFDIEKASREIGAYYEKKGEPEFNRIIRARAFNTILGRSSHDGLHTLCEVFSDIEYKHFDFLELSFPKKIAYSLILKGWYRTGKIILNLEAKFRSLYGLN